LIAIALALVVFTYTSLANFLECGMHHEATAHEQGEPHHHHDPASSHHSGTTEHGRHPVEAACCHAALFNVNLSNDHVLETLRAHAFTPGHRQLASGPVSVILAEASPLAHATGPPIRGGPSTQRFADRPLFLTLSALLI